MKTINLVVSNKAKIQEKVAKELKMSINIIGNGTWSRSIRGSGNTESATAGEIVTVNIKFSP